MATQHKRRRYSDNDKATALAALDANGGNVLKTATQLRIPRKTLEEWNNGRVVDDVAELRHENRRELKEVLRDLAYTLAEALSDNLEDAPTNHKAVALGIVIEKMQLLEGKATERLDVNLDDRERATRITTLLDAARNRRDGSSPSDGEFIQ